MKNYKITINVISSGLQVIVIGIVYFFLYKYLLHVLNVETLGVWSVVLATSSLANLANFGIASSVIRYVAIYCTNDDAEKVKRLIFTSAIFLFAIFSLFSLLLYPFAQYILKFVIKRELIEVAISLLPYSIACLILNSLASVFASVLDGIQKNYLRSIIFTTSSVILLFSTFALTPIFGLKGVAIAQLIQALFSLALCLAVVIKRLHYNPFVWNWDQVIFREIFSYGIKFQFISITAMFNEPVTKTLLAKYGGLAYTGYYEMASRLVSQVRGVVVGATQSLIPVLIEKTKESREVWLEFYKKTFIRVFLISFSFMIGLVLIRNIASIVWIGHDESIFDRVILLLALSTFINLICTPAYFSYIANANMKILIISHITASLLNVALGFILGYFFNGDGIVISWVLATIISSLIVLIDFHKQNKIGLYKSLSTKLKKYT